MSNDRSELRWGVEQRLEFIEFRLFWEGHVNRSDVMTQFGLSGKDIPHVADLLAAGAGKAMGGVDDLGVALKQGGLVASQFGLSIEETVGGLSA